MIKIRTAKHDDLNAISLIHNSAWKVEHEGLDNPQLLQRLNQIFTPEKMAERLRKISKARTNPSEVFFRVALLNEDVVSFMEATRVNDIQESVVLVERLYVNPKYHRQGIGRELISSLLDWLSDGEKLEIIVAEYNHSIIRFYSNLGFVQDQKYLHENLDLPAIKMTMKVSSQLRDMFTDKN